MECLLEFITINYLFNISSRATFRRHYVHIWMVPSLLITQNFVVLVVTSTKYNLITVCETLLL